MKHPIRLLLLLLSVGSCLASYAAHASVYVGRWRGSVAGIPLVLDVAQGPDSTLTVLLSSPNQGAFDIPCTQVKVGNVGLSFSVPSIGASYAGVANDDGTKIRGTFMQGAMMPLNFTRQQAEAESQDKPTVLPYAVSEVEISSPAGKLAGTLTLPESPVAAVVMVTGSGPQNRDEEMFGHKPFAVLADSLTRAGVAVLRCDDRGVGGSTAGRPSDTTLDLAGDALAMLEWMKARPELKKVPVGILGHSEGGTIAFINAAEHPRLVDFAVSLAGAAVSGREILVKQNHAIAEAAGHPLDAATSAQVERIFEIISTEPDAGSMTAQLQPIVGEQTAAMTSPWYVAFVRLDPRGYMKRVKCPVLALNGTWDSQVDADMNLGSVRENIPGAKTVALDGLNHLFQRPQSKAQAMDYSAPVATPDPGAIRVVTEWITSVVRK